MRSGSLWRLEGAAAFLHDDQPVRLDYAILCASDWRTRYVHVHGSVGTETVDVTIEAGDDGSWRLNGDLNPMVAGCIDIDLNFSPSTNLLPIRRLSPKVGERVAVRAAWLRFPSFKLEPLEQTYSHLADDLYRYESAGGSFVAELRVSAAGFPLHYAGIWRVEATAEAR